MTAHATDMTALRGIDRAWIELTISSPDWTDADPLDRRLLRAFRQIDAADGRTLRVVYRVEGEDAVVITCFLDRGARR
ncbi:MAG TPA: DUF4258 domain-containing protein [Caulobacteraceae bacterium]|jgi:hypothetical protein|nr:DUF4258 domain-containing protein [Caulobacteraceae bacterium]